jgi:hypothetical protein
MRDVFSSAQGFPLQCAGFTYDHLTTMAARAVARGETPFDVEEVIDHVIAPIIYHILYDDRAITSDYCHALLDRLGSLPHHTTKQPTRSKLRAPPTGCR